MALSEFDIGTKGEVSTDAGQAGYPYGMPMILGVVGVIGSGLEAQHLWATRRWT